MPRIVCHCQEIAEDEIIRVIRERKPQSLAQLIMYTGAGAGCGRCIPDLRDLLKSRSHCSSGGDNTVQGNNRELSP
ncbi:MAG: (2Fe-2S)-binding protein [Bacteroidales bacterium]